MSLLLAGCAAGSHRREPAAVRTDERACLVLLEYWGREAEKVRASIGQISDRSKLFGPDIRRMQGVFALMRQTQQEAIDLATRAQRLKGSARDANRDAAVARVEALWLALPIVTLQLNYLILASHGEDAGVVSTHWQDMLAEVERRTRPVLEAMRGFDRKHMAAVAAGHREYITELHAMLPRFEKALVRGSEWSRRGIRIADGVTLVMSAYELYTAVRGMRRGGPDLTFRFPALVQAGTGGVSAAGVVVIPAEVLESLRHLIKIGALDSIVLTAGFGPAYGKPELVGGGPRFAMDGPGRVRPSRAPDPNAKPRGSRSRPKPNDREEKRTSHQRENESADVLARAGYDVEQNPPRLPNGRQPDYRIEGEYFDLVTPRTSRARNIWSDIKDDKVSPKDGKVQANRVVLDLSETKVELAQLRAQFSDYPMPNLKEVIVITQEGQVILLWP